MIRPIIYIIVIILILLFFYAIIPSWLLWPIIIISIGYDIARIILEHKIKKDE
jgi:hypothetical protein